MPRAAELGSLDFTGSQHALEELDREIAAAGIDRKRTAAIEKRLLGVLRRADATFAARQAVCQRLGILYGLADVNSPASVPDILAAMLAQERYTELARLALEPAPGGAVDRAFLDALQHLSGRARVAVIQSLGNRRARAAVPQLAGLLADPDPAVSTAAVNALGRIGNAAALAALGDAPAGKRAAIQAAKLAVAQRLDPTAAAAIFLELYHDSRAGEPLQAAAFRGLLEAEPAAAPARIVEVLGGNQASVRQAALESVSSLPPAVIAAALSARLDRWDPPTQAAVIAALARIGDATSVSVVTAAIFHEHEDVRAAAITALGHLPGTRDTALLLGRIAAGEDHAEATLARRSLARHHGAGVAEAVLEAAEEGKPAWRAAFIEQLALRNMTEGVPLLLNCRDDLDVSVRRAALGALGRLAPPSAQGALLDWAIGATDRDEQSRALRALVNLLLRHPEFPRAVRPVLRAIESAPPDLALRLLPALPRLGGRRSAESAARLALREDPAVADAAALTLARWPDRTALPSLVTVAEKSPIATVRAAAVDGALRHLGGDDASWPAESTEMLARILDVSREDDVRRRAVELLRRAADEPALILAEALAAEPAHAASAGDAAQVIRSNLAGPPAVRASAAVDEAGHLLDGNELTRWSVPASAGEWIEIDFHRTRPLRRLALHQAGRADEFPEQYEVYVTDEPSAPGAPRVRGAGARGRTVITLPAGTRGRYLIIRNTAWRDDSWWSITELLVE